LNKSIIRLILTGAICAAVLYALRVWRVSAGTPVGTRVLAVSSSAALAGVLGLAASVRKRAVAAGAVLMTAGSVLTICAVAVEYGLGSAAVASLAPEQTAVFGTLEATLSGFEASYREQGVLSDVSSSLVLDAGSGARNFTVASGRPIRFEHYHICQLGFDLEGGHSPRAVRTHLGLLNQRAYGPFLGGLAVLGAGVVVSVFPFRRGVEA
jgi:hypothetical protein